MSDGTAGLDGIIADLKVWTGGDRTAGTQVMDMPLDEDWVSSAIARNDAGAITATAINITSADAEAYTYDEDVSGWISNTELITQDVWENPANANVAWTYDAGANTWSLAGDGSFQNLQLLFTPSQPQIMYLDSTVLALSGGGNMVFTDNSSPITAATDGNYKMVIDKAISNNQQYKRGSGSINVTLAKPSLRKLLPITGDA